MPLAAPRPCTQPCCPALVRGGGPCPAHRRARERERGSAASRGYDARWRRARLGYLRQHPLCVQCEADGRVTPASVVDHVTPHRGDKRLFWDEANWQPLCKEHHDRKTATDDGGFGR